ncbi:hypothetical protein [Flavobacterium humi]|uniref:Protein BatD n=1 Tax=Flavobacterium humi TaxID=2562683 RepID=A0A4Z0LB83_9FLAO|nr:hypothetical protein [Flavobacterium humi]TGD58535.1 hypothetical protein E4635_06375 [Flavobacterium humi]
MNLKFYFLLLIASAGLAQTKPLETSVDTTKNKIGAQFTLTLKAKVNASSKVLFPNAKNFGSLEVIESYPVDTVKENSRYELIKKYGLTQFDSGKYVIPRIPVLIDRIPVFSDSIAVEVSNVKVDTLKQKMYDIKPIIQVRKPMGDWWKYLLGLLGLIGLGFLAYFLWKKYRKEPEKAIVYNSPIEKATSLLQLLEKKELLQKGEVKEYYSELTDITRDYIEEAIEVPAKESTTSELIVALRAASAKKKMKLSKETLEGLEKVLKQADLVKFAKSKPLDFEIEEDRRKIENTISVLDKSIPVVIDETSKKWELLQQEIKLKKEKRNKKLAIGGIVLGSIVLLLGFIVATKGVDYVKNGFVGHSTKELLNGQWIRSDYGNPSVTIETPEVLKRLDAKKTAPKDAMALIKDMQMFGYGSLIERFNIVVSTIQFKKETDADLTQALNGTIQTLESQGCQNILAKQEEFNTEKGIKGVKGYGTLTFEKQKMYYEILLFSQSGGLQQIMVMHREGDENAQKISERMLNSVELQITN